MGVDPIQLEDASSDHPGQPDESEPIPAVESQTGPEGGREGDVDKNKAGQTKPSYPHPDVKAEVASGNVLVTFLLFRAFFALIFPVLLFYFSEIFYFS